jgi:hypothetical protein
MAPRLICANVIFSLYTAKGPLNDWLYIINFGNL